MKNLSGFNKFMFVLNMVLTILTFIAYVLPFLRPRLFPFLSVLTVLMPIMLVLNFCFFMYWLLQAKKQMLLSGLVLLLGITFVSKFYRFSAKETPHDERVFVVMSYNVRLFNLYDLIKNPQIPQNIANLIKENEPDVLCFQEFSKKGEELFAQYKYNFIYYKKGTAPQAIYSNYRIINSGNIEFPNTANSVIFADIQKGTDTVRIYSMHLQSIKISPDINEEIDEEKSKLIFRRLSEGFKKQQLQAEMLQKHKDECPYKMIICGDLNNSAYSYVYRSIKGKMKDTFEEAGEGFGKSYDYKFYPARIDYIFADAGMEVKEFKTFDMFKNSDHFPVMARLALTKEEEETLKEKE